MLSLVVFGFAMALFVVHLLGGRVRRDYVLAAFIMSAIVAAGDLREYAGQVCTMSTSTTTTTSGPLDSLDSAVQTYSVEVCEVRYTVKVEALIALIASIGFTMVALALEVLSRLAAAAGWGV